MTLQSNRKSVNVFLIIQFRNVPAGLFDIHCTKYFGKIEQKLKVYASRDFPVVQWLRLHLPMQGVRVRSLVGELKSHMPWGQKTST